MIRNRLVRICLYALGVLSVLLGVTGIILPVLPGTPFIFLAAWCFLKSSKNTHQWMCRQPILGAALKDWERNQSISKRTKLFALSMISISLTFIWIKSGNIWIKGPVTLLLLAVSIFIFTRKEASKL